MLFGMNKVLLGADKTVAAIQHYPAVSQYYHQRSIVYIFIALSLFRNRNSKWHKMCLMTAPTVKTMCQFCDGKDVICLLMFSVTPFHFSERVRDISSNHFTCASKREQLYDYYYINLDYKTRFISFFLFCCCLPLSFYLPLSLTLSLSRSQSISFGMPNSFSLDTHVTLNEHLVPFEHAMRDLVA